MRITRVLFRVSEAFAKHVGNHDLEKRAVDRRIPEDKDIEKN